jgi:hypothetical protein
MAKLRALIPLKLLISAAVVFALSFAAKPVIDALVPQEQATSNVLLIAIPFLFIFIPIILLYMAVIVFAGKLLGNRIPEAAHRIIDSVFVAGIILGIIGMFQPWLFALFRASFIMLLVSTLGFILWSHVAQKRAQR